MSQCCTLKFFVTGRCGYFHPVFFSLSSWRAGSHLSSWLNSRTQSKSSCLGCLWARERGRHLQAEFNLADLKWDGLSSGLFFLPLLTLSHRPVSGFKNTGGREGESCPLVLSGRSCPWGMAQTTALQQRQLGAQRNILCWKMYTS